MIKPYQKEIVLSAVSYIEDNLEENIRVLDIANAVHLSLYHFCRLFNQITHYSPYNYLQKRRLTEAAKDLLSTDNNISEIAFKYEFNSHEAFSRAFRRVHGILPKEFRKKINQSNLNLMQILNLETLDLISTAETEIIMKENSLQLCGFMDFSDSSYRNNLKGFDLLLKNARTQNHSLSKLYTIYWKDGDTFFRFIGFDNIENRISSMVTNVFKFDNSIRLLTDNKLDEELVFNYLLHYWKPQKTLGKKVNHTIIEYKLDSQNLKPIPTQYSISF